MPLGQRRADAEIGVGAERGNDLLGVAACPRIRHALGLAARLGLVLDGLQHLGIEHQLLDQLAPARELEGRDLEPQALVQFIDGPIGPPPQPPAQRRAEQPVDQRNERPGTAKRSRPTAALSPTMPPQRLPRDEICQLACKPGSVWRVAPPRRPFIWGADCCRASSNQPGRRPGSRLDTGVAPRIRAAPIRSCSRWGLPCRLRCRKRGALLPHRFTLAFAGCPAPAVCSLWHFPWGRPRRPLAATVDPWSPDFPPPGAYGRKACSPGSGRPASWQDE